MKKHVRNCRSICQSAGLTILSINSRRKHLHIITSGGLIVAPKTPSCTRWQLHLRAVARRAAANDHNYNFRPISSFIISLVPPKMRVTRAARHARAIGYSFI